MSRAVEITTQTGNFNWLNPSHKMFILRLTLPDNAPVSYIEATWHQDEEPRWENQPPSQVAEIIERGLRRYVSTSKQAMLDGIAWVRKHAVDVDALWAAAEIEKVRKRIAGLEAEIEKLTEYLTEEEA